MKRSVVIAAAGALLAGSFSAYAESVAAASDSRPSLSQTVGAIVAYTRWPQASASRTLCQLGSTAHGSELRQVGRSIEHRMLPSGTTGFAGCDILYIGQISAEQKREATTPAKVRGVLTIEETNAKCVGRAMVCVRFTGSKHQFDLNLDSIARSGLQISPRILRMSAGDAK